MRSAASRGRPAALRARAAAQWAGRQRHSGCLRLQVPGVPRRPCRVRGLRRRAGCRHLPAHRAVVQPHHRAAGLQARPDRHRACVRCMRVSRAAAAASRARQRVSPLLAPPLLLAPPRCPPRRRPPSRRMTIRTWMMMCAPLFCEMLSCTFPVSSPHAAAGEHVFVSSTAAPRQINGCARAG